MSSEEKEKRRKLAHAVTGGVFLIGLAILFYFDLFWPWILALVGILVILEALLH
ncbi:MAG: hypothetical protein QXE10_02360 [Desulfurococcaceae archaeon]